MDPLENARERLEAALSQLAGQAMSLQGQINLADQTTTELEQNREELGELKSALERVEMENLRLHEKIAALTLEDRKSESETVEKLLLQKDSLEKELNSIKQTNQNLSEDNKNLLMENTNLRKDKDAIRIKLDSTIKKVETLLGESA